MKAAEAYRTIGEVSEDLALESHVLRFWESKFSQIKPIKRSGGRRYYRKVDIDLLKKIKGMLYDEGFTIKGVQKHLSSSKLNILRKEGKYKLNKDILRQLKKVREEVSSLKSFL